MDLVEEFQEIEKIPNKVVISYKFLNLFKVYLDGDKRGLHWSVGCVDKKLSDEQLLCLKNYLKVMKSQVKSDDPTTKHAKIMWFLYEKLLEFGAFDIQVRNEIRGFLDLCEYIIL